MLLKSTSASDIKEVYVMQFSIQRQILMLHTGDYSNSGHPSLLRVPLHNPWHFHPPWPLWLNIHLCSTIHLGFADKSSLTNPQIFPDLVWRSHGAELTSQFLFWLWGWFFRCVEKRLLSKKIKNHRERCLEGKGSWLCQEFRERSHPHEWQLQVSESSWGRHTAESTAWFTDANLSLQPGMCFDLRTQQIGWESDKWKKVSRKQKQPVWAKLSPIFGEASFLRGEMWLNLEVRNLKKFACGTQGHYCLGKWFKNGGILHLSYSGLWFFSWKLLSSKNLTSRQGLGSCQAARCTLKEKGSDSWRMLPSEILSSIN